MFKFTEEHIRLLESREREEFLNTEKILKEAGIESMVKESKENAKTSMENAFFKVADIGAGTGYFSIPIAEKLREEHGDAFKGIVLALDVQESMLSYLAEKANKLGISNIIAILMEAYKTPLLSNSIDFVFVANVLHEVENKAKFLKETERIMRKKARICIIDWEKEKSIFKGTEIGPPVHERIEKRQAENLLAELFEIEKEFKAGDFHYGIVAGKV